MNLAQPPTPAAFTSVPGNAPAGQDSDSVNLHEYVGILLDSKWLIALVMMLVIASGLAYAFLAKPVYEANLLLQVEDSKGAANNILGEAASLFDVKTPAAGEIEIIRSRMVLGQAVENAKLYIDAHPKYLPVVGEWLARRANDLSEPGFLGYKGYVSGKEKIVVTEMEVSASLQKEPFVVTTGGGGSYQLEHDELPTPITGTVGAPLDYVGPEGSVRIRIVSLEGLPGAQFIVDRKSRLASIDWLQGRLQLGEKGRQSGVIAATLQGTDPNQLARVLNEIGHQYVRQNVERKAAEAQKTLSFLNEQLPHYKKQQEEAESVYNRYRNQKGTVAFDEEARLVLGQTVELQTKLLEARQRRRELETRFTGSHPTIQSLDSQIAAWNREIDTLGSRVRRMPEIQQDALRMERDVRVNAEMYQSLLNNALQLSLVKEGKIGNVRLLDEAVIPEEPVKPNKPIVLGICVLMGLVAGIALAVLRNSFLRGIRSTQEIELSTGLAVYATIPLSRDQVALGQRAALRKPGVHLLALNSPGDPSVESLRSLRTALQFAMLEASSNRVIITGATPGVGKTFVSANFAAIMAAGGKRTLLIDADLRKGHLNQHVGLKREGGLSELVAGSMEMDQVIHADVLPRLDVMTTGVYPPNPAELMMSDTLKQILDQLSKRYDLVIIDTPPVLVAADTSAVAIHAGAVLLVARADRTYIGELQESVRRLEQAGKSVSGVLLNAMDPLLRRYGSYGYKYGGANSQYSYSSDAARS